ncbi:hypothetical protein NPIL_108971 [Nephila pilipes]|uniref:Uncharacterized protein n=1 Tax=Nephila pilipes TaxID=299642 RepID=A0A8X6T3T4_NEPPI|nr:hypothetical protein NPIL_108971 [Nephila pilipes]
MRSTSFTAIAFRTGLQCDCNFLDKIKLWLKYYEKERKENPLSYQHHLKRKQNWRLTQLNKYAKEELCAKKELNFPLPVCQQFHSRKTVKHYPFRFQQASVWCTCCWRVFDRLTTVSAVAYLRRTKYEILDVGCNICLQRAACT